MAAKAFTNTISADNKLTLISNFHTMLASGIPIMETVDSLLEDSKGGQKKLLEQMRLDLGQGQHMYATFEKFPRIFDKVTVNIIKAAEESGTLDTALEDLIHTIKKDIEFNDKIKSALMYPVFIGIVFVVVLVVILVVVIPRIATVFTSLNVDLPAVTKVMINMSDALIKYPLPIFLAFAVIIGVFVFIYKQNKGLFVQFFTSLPVISKLAQQIDITRFTRSLYLLLSAGIPITVALELTQDVVMKKNIQLAIKHAKSAVFAGKQLSQGLKESKKVIPPVTIKIIEAGERSGNLDKAMLDVSDYMDYQVSKSLKAVTAMIEPIMLVVVAVMVGGMMVSIIGPIYQMIGSVSPN